MKTPSRDIPFGELLQHEEFPSVSIFVGNDQPWPGNRRAMLALKGEVKRCRELLDDHGVSPKEVDQMLQPLEAWTEEGEKWKNVAQSLMVYLTKSELRIYEIDQELTDSAHVGHVYDIRPLIPLREFRSFYLLEVSQERAALHCVLPSGYETLDVPDLPASFDEFTKYDDRERVLQSRTFKTTSSRNALFHGHGLMKDAKKAQLDQYAKSIAGEVHNKLADKSDPLAVVGLPPLLSMVLEAESFDNLAFTWERDPSSEPFHSLLDQVRKRYRDQLLTDYEETVEEALSFHVSRPNLESRIAEIVRKSYAGLVRQLFLRKEDYVWGRFNPENQEVEVLRSRVEHTEDLLNRACIYTLRSGGEVYLFDSKKYQAPEHAVALLRTSPTASASSPSLSL